MKGLPDRPEGPKGPWYKKVNAMIRAAEQCRTRQELVELLGDPDDVVPRGGEDGIDFSMTYVDPYRPRMRYRFDLCRERIVGRGREMTVLPDGLYRDRDPGSGA